MSIIKQDSVRLQENKYAVNIGFLNIQGNYVHLHENLLDLSHLSFLHGKTFGTPDFYGIDVPADRPGVAMRRHLADRAEVLRGPQGTLFGRNTSGGLVHFISRKPTREFSAYVVSVQHAIADTGDGF